MARSVLLQLARDSITEVFEAQNHIDRASLLNEYPLLNEKIQTDIYLYVAQELVGSYKINTQETSLLENIILAAKKAAFEDINSKTLTTALYLHAEIKLTLYTPDGKISETDPPIITIN